MLTLKIPPPAVTLMVAVIMWFIASVTPVLMLPMPLRIAAALAISILGGVFSLAGMISFRRAKTTVNPLRPERTVCLVRGGIYKVTRNPMYVGLLCVLLGWAIFLCAPLSLFGPVFFVLYLNEFQIKPEEGVLLKLFGNDYREYLASVRRWL